MIDGVADIHTHNLSAPSGSVISVEPGAEFLPGRLYSVGFHPYTVGEGKPLDFERLGQDAERCQVVAIGETGIDKLRGGPVDRQIEVLRRHAELSESLRKPLILHAVKTFPELIALRRELKPSQRWIVHGFRGKAQLARELLSHGFDLSLGERFNPEAAALIPAGRLWFETDTSTLPIDEITRRVGLCRD